MEGPLDLTNFNLRADNRTLVIKTKSSLIMEALTAVNLAWFVTPASAENTTA
jgi:hypothetical protein